MRHLRLVIVIVLLLLVGCSRTTDEKTPSDSLYENDFAADTGEWQLESDMEASAGFANGKLQLDITSPNLVAWATLKDRKFDDFVLEVDATQIAGPDDNSYGVLFRIKNPTAFYRFDISGDGYFVVERRDETNGGQWTRLTQDWLQTDAIHQGASTNRIKIIAQGSLFTFFINEQQVAEIEDSTYRSGTVGLDAGSMPNAGGVTIGFDNLTIREP